jgi:hypothetical protein
VTIPSKKRNRFVMSLSLRVCVVEESKTGTPLHSTRECVFDQLRLTQLAATACLCSIALMVREILCTCVVGHCKHRHRDAEVRTLPLAPLLLPFMHLRQQSYPKHPSE